MSLRASGQNLTLGTRRLRQESDSYRTLSLPGGSCSLCPFAVIELPHGSAQSGHSVSARWPTFDNAQSRMAAYQRDVVGHHWLG